MAIRAYANRYLAAFAVCSAILCSIADKAEAMDFTKWSAFPPEFVGGKQDAGKLRLDSGSFRVPESNPAKWVGWFTESPARDLEVQATMTVTRLASDFGWFGQSWSVWPDPAYGDNGFEAGIGLAIDHKNAAGYRVQFSHKYQSVALVRYPQGGYVRVVPCPIEKDKPLAVTVVRRGREIRVRVVGQELIHYLDPLPHLPAGQVGLLTSSRGAVEFANVNFKVLPMVSDTEQPVPSVTTHKPNFSSRKWLGDHPWVFDGDEPILMLPIQYKQNDTYYVQVINSVKLRPGLKPMLMWNAHWDIAGQGAYKEGGSKSTEPQVHGGGTTLRADWQANHYANRFQTKTTLTIGFDPKRGSYTYDMDSQLEILPGSPFHIQAFELEHHTPLDPFNWKYLVIRKSKDELVHRPVFPIDPGPLYNIAGQNGLRMWYGRHNEPMVLAPAVEYAIEPSQRSYPDNPKVKVPREIHTAVCAAFYDTGIAYGAEELPAGSKVRSRYRYTGYPAEEAERIFKSSKLMESPRLDPNHHYVWADPWPRLTFAKGRAMSEPWWDGMPYMTAHNQRPTYKWAKNTGTGSGFALQLPPRSFGQSDVPLPKPLAAGRYIMRGLCKAERVVGPGGRIELTAFAKDDRKLAEFTHYLGTGDFNWKPYGFVFTLPAETTRLNVAFGNAGTGDVFIGDSRFEELPAGAPVPAEVAAQPQSQPAQYDPSPKGALFDARLTEGKGHYVFNHAGASFEPLELCNVTWDKAEGRTGLRFAQKVAGDRPDFARGGTLEFFFFGHDAYTKSGKSKSFAISGSHGTSLRDYKAMTLATWIRPAAEMSKGQHVADILGFGSRRVRLHLLGEKAPYQFGVRFTEGGEFLWSGEKATLNADRWYHVAMTAEANAENHWDIKLYIDGKLVQQAVAKNAAVPLKCHASIILGTELHYMHDHYYHGLIGRTLVFDRALREAEIAELLRLP